MIRHTRTTIDADVTPRFTACYLRTAGEECAFIEAHTSHALPRLLAALGAHGKRPEDVRWVVVTHAHLDVRPGGAAKHQSDVAHRCALAEGERIAREIEG